MHPCISIYTHANHMYIRTHIYIYRIRNCCIISRVILPPPPQPQDLRGGGFYPGLQPPDQLHTLVMARLTMLRNLDTRARVEDTSISDRQQGLHDRFVQYFNGDHRRQRVEHYCHEDWLSRRCFVCFG